jgi:predicted transglutaminase-like cysteine proteinase
MTHVVRNVLLTAAGAMLLPSALPAQLTTPLGSSIVPRGAVYSKTEAILGSPSKLAAIMASQSATASVAPRPGAFSTPIGATVQPASRVVPDDRPDVFGSVALAVASTPLDSRWHKVEHAALGAQAASYVDGLAGFTALERIDAVNRFVNASIQFANDGPGGDDGDAWDSASRTLARGTGDCEDYAIAKMQMLRRAGFAAKDLYLVVLRDTRRARDHAVLVIREDGRLLVLDNGTTQILDSDSVTNYEPIFTFAENRAWTHGYRRAAPAPSQLAQTESKPAIDGAAAMMAMAAIRLPSAAVGFRF